jgi:hypothetical protein
MADINEVVVRGSAAGFAQEILAGRAGRSKQSPLGCATVRFTQPTAPIAKPEKECLTTSRATSNSRGG